MSDEVAEYTTALMHSPLRDFTAARSERVRTLRREGKQDLAKRIAELRKPSIALWALNQAGHVAAADLEAVRSAGEGMRRVQERLLQGDRAAANQMQRAAQEQRSTIDVLSRRLGMVLGASGHAASEDTLRRIGDALRSLSIADGDTWAALRDGRLLSEPELASFPMIDVTRLDRAMGERADQEVEAQRKRLVEAAEADVRHAAEREAAARDQEESARQRREQATVALEEARAALSRLRNDR